MEQVLSTAAVTSEVNEICFKGQLSSHSITPTLTSGLRVEEPKSMPLFYELACPFLLWFLYTPWWRLFSKEYC